MTSVKALVQVDFPMHALSEHLSTNKTLVMKQCDKKWQSSKHYHFVKKHFNGIKLPHANVECVYIMYAKYQNVSVKAVHALSMHKNYTGK